MSKDALAGVYAALLTDDAYRNSIAENPEILNDWDLTDEEKEVLTAEATAEVSGFAIGSGPVMSHFSATRGPQLSPGVASALGGAINNAAGLPTGALDGPGFVTRHACCPWGHGVAT